MLHNLYSSPYIIRIIRIKEVELGVECSAQCERSEMDTKF
jgi:hypothetical protein